MTMNILCIISVFYSVNVNKNYFYARRFTKERYEEKEKQ